VVPFFGAKSAGVPAIFIHKLGHKIISLSRERQPAPEKPQGKTTLARKNEKSSSRRIAFGEKPR